MFLYLPLSNTQNPWLRYTNLTFEDFELFLI